MNINCKIPSTFPYVGNFHKMSEKKPYGSSCCSCSKGQTVKANVPCKGSLTFPAHLSPCPTTCTLGSSHSQPLPVQQRGLALSTLNLHTRFHFFLEHSSPPLTARGRTLPYPSCLSLVSSKKLSLIPEVWLSTLLCTSTTYHTLHILHCSVSAYLCVSFSVSRLSPSFNKYSLGK